MKICKCEVCENIIDIIDDMGGKLVCCEEAMTTLIPENSDGAREKHVPIVEKEGNEIIVKVGSVKHPMDNDHYINWIALENDNTIIRTKLMPNDEPEAKFPYIKGSIVYAYCDKHGLWQTVVE